MVETFIQFSNPYGKYVFTFNNQKKGFTYMLQTNPIVEYSEAKVQAEYFREVFKADAVVYPK